MEQNKIILYQDDNEITRVAVRCVFRRNVGQVVR